MTARRLRAAFVVRVRGAALGKSVLSRFTRQWPLSLAAVLVIITAMALPSNAGAVPTVTLGYGPELVDGSYINAQNTTNNLVFTSVAIVATTSITITEDLDLSTSIYGIPAFDLSLIAPTINVGANVNFSSYGNVFLTANTLNLSGKLTSGASLINPSRVFSTATHVNGLSNAASIQQAMDISSKTAPVTVQVSTGQFDEDLTIAKPLTLRGNDGTAAAGADPTAPEIFGTQAGGQIITVTANNVTIDGLHLDGAVAGGSLADSANGIYANGVDNLMVSQNTFEGFSGPSVSTPGSTNVTLDANLTIGTTPPATAIALDPVSANGLGGWYVSSVNAAVSATSDTSVAETRCVLDPASAPAAFDDIPANCAFTGAGASVASDGLHMIYAASADDAGNEETPVSASFMIDQTGPAVTCDVASPGPAFVLGGAGGNVTAIVSDPSPGSGPVATSLSDAANVSSVGSKTVSLTGEDEAGSETTVDCPYRVEYDFLGFFQPVDNLPTVNSVKAGAAVPVKFSLDGFQGLEIFAAGYPKSELISCNSTAAVDGIEETVTSGSSSLSYDSALDQYTYVWKTNKAWANTCRQLVVKLADGTYHRANFKLK